MLASSSRLPLPPFLGAAFSSANLVPLHIPPKNSGIVTLLVGQSKTPVQARIVFDYVLNSESSLFAEITSLSSRNICLHASLQAKSPETKFVIDMASESVPFQYSLSGHMDDEWSDNSLLVATAPFNSNKSGVSSSWNVVLHFSPNGKGRALLVAKNTEPDPVSATPFPKQLASRHDSNSSPPPTSPRLSTGSLAQRTNSNAQSLPPPSPINRLYQKSMKNIPPSSLEMLGSLIDGPLQAVANLAWLLSTRAEQNQGTQMFITRNQNILSLQLSSSSGWSTDYMQSLLMDLNSSQGMLFKQSLFALSRSCALFYSTAGSHVRRIGSLSTQRTLQICLDLKTNKLLGDAVPMDWTNCRANSDIRTDQFQLLLLCSNEVALHIPLLSTVALPPWAEVQAYLQQAFWDTLSVEIMVQGADTAVPTGKRGFAELCSRWREQNDARIGFLKRTTDPSYVLVFGSHSDSIRTSTRVSPPDWFPRQGIVASLILRNLTAKSAAESWKEMLISLQNE